MEKLENQIAVLSKDVGHLVWITPLDLTLNSDGSNAKLVSDLQQKVSDQLRRLPQRLPQPFIGLHTLINRITFRSSRS